MINQQLIDFIKSQLLKGIEKETISKELMGNGWSQLDIEYGFNNINTELQIPQKIPNPSIDTKIVPTKNNLFKKTTEVFLLISGVILLLLELLNFSAYVYLRGTHLYKPAVFQIVNSINESINPDESKIPDFLETPNYKPVIYLYPTQTQKVKVELDYKGTLIVDYPAYDYSQKGWNVTAYPDGKIINKDGKEYSYLFWEGEPTVPTNYDLSTGFVIKGGDTVKFLQDTLSSMGLTPKEYNEFIVYWYPKMKDNKYNLIHFADKQYTDTAPLTITPTPDSMLRVFMVFKPLDKAVEVKSQEIKSFNRIGFSVIEWGGTELKK